MRGSLQFSLLFVLLLAGAGTASAFEGESKFATREGFVATFRSPAYKEAGKQMLAQMGKTRSLF